MTLDILTHPALPEGRHGFFTRKGGASRGIYAGLNCGPGSRDDAQHVRANRARVAEAMGVDATALISVYQVHSPRVVTVTGPDFPGQEADAMVTSTPGVALGVLSADCAPVLFCDPVAGVAAAAHSGWKGAVGGVLDATVDAMVALGARREGITAIVGPTISQRAYEVGPEFMDRFLDEGMENSRFFAQGKGDRLMFDLPGFALHRLREAGVGRAEWTGHCTFSDPDRFFSYRRTTHAGEPDYGRLISAIRL